MVAKATKRQAQDAISNLAKSHILFHFILINPFQVSLLRQFQLGNFTVFYFFRAGRLPEV